MNRRDFLRTVGSAALAGSLIGQKTSWANGTQERTPAQPFRKGVWAQMREFLISPEQIAQRMDRLAEGGVSLIVPGADKPGMLMPDGRRGVHWASNLTTVSPDYPDWDPLKVVIEKCRERDIDVHVWLRCFKSPGIKGPWREQHPETEAQFPTLWGPNKYQGGWACAMQPRVQKRLFDLFREIHERYHPAGLHLDFIRTGDQCMCDYCTAQMARVGIDIHEVTGRYADDRWRWLMTATHGMLRKYGVRTVVGKGELDPVLVDEELDQWLQWRNDRMSAFVAQMHAYTQKHGMELSAAVKYFWPRQVPTGAQDWVRWGRENLVDYMMVMNYTPDVELVARVTSETITLLQDSKVQHWPGLGRSVNWAPSPEALAEQIHIVRSLGTPGVIIFQEPSMTDADFPMLKRI